MQMAPKESWLIAGQFCLFLGCMGQAAFLSPLLRPPLFAAFACLIPYLLVYSITFFRVSPISPKAFRVSLLVAAGWFAASTVFAEVANFLGYLPPDGPQFAKILGRTLMHLGWFSLLSIKSLHRYALAAERLLNDQVNG